MLSQDMEQLKTAVLKACKVNGIKFPITRQGYIDICKALNFHATTHQAIEAILESRGRLMEEAPPDNFDFNKMLEFMNRTK
jgi:hypothetical protein